MKILAVTNIFPSPANPALGTYVEQQVRSLRDIGLTVDVWFLDRAVEGRGVYWHLSSRLRERVKAEPYDLVHVMYGGLMSDLATKAVHTIPTVLTIHGSDLLGSALARPDKRFSAYIGVLASKRAARRADGVIVVSTGLRDALPREINPSRVRIIPCGIDLDLFKPLDPVACRQELGWDADTIHILFSTTGDPIKRPELASRAVTALGELGIRAEIHEMRGIAYDRVPVWINASDALILTSRHEGSPTIVKECLACNVPVVSVDVGDVRDQLAGIDGCIISAPDPVELAMGLREVCSTRRRTNSRDQIARWALKAAAERVNEFYCEIVDARVGSLRRENPLTPLTSRRYETIRDEDR